MRKAVAIVTTPQPLKHRWPCPGGAGPSNAENNPNTNPNRNPNPNIYTVTYV